MAESLSFVGQWPPESTSCLLTGVTFRKGIYPYHKLKVFVPLKVSLTYGCFLTTYSEEVAEQNKADRRRLAESPCLDLRTKKC